MAKAAVNGVEEEAGSVDAEAKGVLVAIPAYNEEVALGSVVLRARAHADEVLVVDDGSEDGTAGVAEMAQATVVAHRKNLGKGAALRTAFDYARRNGHEVLVVLDGDGQHDPEAMIANKELGGKERTEWSAGGFGSSPPPSSSRPQAGTRGLKGQGRFR